jgi:hypothetical protein
MAQHAIQRPMRARLAIGTGLLAAGMLLAAPAATAFAGPLGGCTSFAAKGKPCHDNKGVGTTRTATTTDTGTPMSHHACAKTVKPAPEATD